MRTEAYSKAGTDQLLVSKVQAGDKGAFDLLVLKYQHKVGNIVSRYVANSEEINDVAQDTFLRAYRGISSFRGDGLFCNWLYEIATDTARNYRLSQSRKATHHDTDSDNSHHSGDAERFRDVADPQIVYRSNEVEPAVLKSFQSLPYECRKSLSLREIDGLSYNEIANIMNCPIGTVRSRISKSRNTIQKSLQPTIIETLVVTNLS